MTYDEFLKRERERRKLCREQRAADLEELAKTYPEKAREIKEKDEKRAANNVRFSAEQYERYKDLEYEDPELFKAQRDKRRAYSRKHYEKNRELLNAEKREKRKADPESVRARDRAYYAEHREHILELNRQYRLRKKQKEQQNADN